MTTIQKLDLTPEQLENVFFGKYAKWCESVTINDCEFQKVLANAKINRWFLMEYAKCEAEFELLTQCYVYSPLITSRDYLNCYDQCLHQLFNIRPMALLQEIKRTKEAGNPVLIFNSN